MSKPIPIDSAKDIAHTFGYDQVIVIGRHVGETGCEHITTYGKSEEHCRAAAKIGDFLKYKVMGWPEYDEVDRLRCELADARATLQRQSESHADEVRLKRKYFQKTREQAKLIARLNQLRQARLSELLEAEARERVRRQYFDLSENVTFDMASRESGTVRLSKCGTIDIVTKFVNAESQIFCLAAALAEKRRREGEVTNGDS